jgi:hypothetical protein
MGHPNPRRRRILVKTNPGVDRWFQKLDHPLKELMLLVRKMILEADDRITESIKWSAPTFEYKGNLASFQPNAKKFVSLMFHRGSEIPGKHPALVGDGALVRIMRFQDVRDAENHQESLEAIVHAWCDWKDA